jgi:L-asparaginase II
MCSGFHISSLMLSRLKGWSLPDYWRPEHGSQVAVREAVAKVFETKPAQLVTGVDACGVLTYAFPLASIATAFAYLADPASATTAGRRALAPSMTRIRDAMVAAPDMVGGTRDSSDSALMRARPRMLVVKGGAEGLRGVGLFAGARGGDSQAAGLAVKIEDGNAHGRANRSTTIEALSQLKALDAPTLERLKEQHYPPMRDPRGVEVGQAVPTFQLAPFTELG